MFPTEAGSSQTNWELIHDAARGNPLPGTAAIETGGNPAMEHLVRRYWPAVFAYIRKSGRDIHEAADLTQGFVCDIIIGRNLFKSADSSRGRFRSLLLTALQNYLREKHRFNSRVKRAGNARPLSLEGAVLAEVESTAGHCPEAAYATQWGATLVRRVLEGVREACLKSGFEAHWAVFEARVVRPMLFGDPRVSYPRLVDRLNLSDAGQAANMMITVKRRFVQALIEEVGATVNDPLQVEQELRELLRDLERKP